VSYFNADAGIAFVGDTAGIKITPGGYVLPPTPPPDIDLEIWNASLARIEAWHPRTMLLTHFGPAAPCGPHITELRDHLAFAADLVRASLARDEDDGSREAWFRQQLRLELRRCLGEGEEHAYEIAGPFHLSWRGLARYWRKREQ
jgi:glyoxylase-like metal-dependent hydrolase (beta-lactamase superfamily II)